MNMTPDHAVFWQWGWVTLNATILTTWLLMLVLTGASWWITRNLSGNLQVTRWQNFLETIILFLRKQIREVGLEKPERYTAFLLTLFLFTAFSALCNIIPGYEAPTSSLSTTSALALCVFIAVPVFGIMEKGVGGYLRRYLQPNLLMLPFTIITELSRTLALAIRLFGNMTSDVMIVGIVITVAPLFFPIILQILGLLTGFVQAYIFTILALVYIAAAVSGKEG